MLLSNSRERMHYAEACLESNKGKAITEIGNVAFFCTNCGTCAGACPNSAIQMKEDRSSGTYLPRIDFERCNHCSICVRVCPGYSHDYVGLNRKIFGQPPQDIHLGNFVRCYIGSSTDHQIRYNSSSGGLVTQLLTLALEDRKIDGAIVTKTDADDPFRPKPFIARTPSEVIAAAKSKYCPVPVNSLIRIIVAEEGRFAVVGLPCHIHGLRKSEQVLRVLRQRIVLHLGLFCSHNVSFLGTDYFLWRLGVAKEDVSSLYYRGGGWPGPPSVSLKDGRSIVDAKGVWNKMFASRFFTPNRCMFCRDSTSELADVSFGDPWLPRLKDERIGKSILISRTRQGQQLLEHALSLKKIELVEVHSGEVKMSQESLLYKKRAVNAFCGLKSKSDCLCRFAGYSVRPSLVDYLVSVIMLANTTVSSKRAMWPILPKWSEMMKLVRRVQTRRSVRASSDS